MYFKQFRILAALFVCMGAVTLAIAGSLVVVPDVIGKSLDNAEKVLISAGLYVASISFEMYDGKPNRVLEQRPKAGRSVEAGSGVKLVVSRPVKGSCKNIKVFEPKEGRKWKVGSTHRILWTVGEDCCDEVSITLWDDGQQVRIIEASTPNDGEYEWDIPRRLDPGKHYRIRVACDTDHDGFSDEFQLKSRK